MKINVTFFVHVTPEGKVAFSKAHSQGVDYLPDDESIVNGIYKATFAIEGEQDKTPAVAVWAFDGVGTGERLG